MEPKRLLFPLTITLLAAACGPTAQSEQETVTSDSELVIAGGVLKVMVDDPVRAKIPGCYRCSIGVADFDGDGKQDIVMAGAFDSAFAAGGASYTTNNVVKLFKNTTSSKGASIRFAAQGEASGSRGAGGALIQVGDFDGNGRPDFAVQYREGSSPESDTATYLNNGNWSFTRKVVAAGFDTNSTSLGMAAADVDHDGKKDLVFASDGNGSGTGLWYKYSGSAWTAQQTTFAHHITYGGAIAAGDLDGDGWDDIVVGGASDTMFGTYDCTSTSLYGQIHFNRGPNGGSIGIRPNATALGQFALQPAGATACTGMVNAGLAVADIDNDGLKDIIIAGSADAFKGRSGANQSMFDLAVLKNRGAGTSFTTFESAGIQSSGGLTNGGAGSMDSPNIAVGDLTADGLPDIFIQGMRPDYPNNPSTYVPDSRFYVNAGGGSFIEIDTPFADVTDGAQAIADFNYDGIPDLIFVGATRASHPNATNNVDNNSASTLVTAIYRNILSGKFNGPIPPATGTTVPPASSPDAGVTPPRDGGTSSTPDSGTSADAGTTPRPDAGSTTPDAGTVAGCSGAPLTGGGSTGAVKILSESGHGLPGCYRCAMDSADFDQDGRTDIVMAGAFDSAWTSGMGGYTYQNQVRLYRNVSCPGQQIRFSLQQTVSGVSGGGGAIVEVGDFNNDGRKDFAVQFREGDAPESDTSSFMNNGSWSFTRRVLASGFDTNSTSMGMTVTDIDRDGLDDLIFNSTGYGAGPGLWYKYSASGNTWSAQQTDYAHNISYGGSIAAGDLNGDGYPDIVIGGNSNQPFGTTNCASTLMYGHIFMNKGAVSPRGIQPASANALGRFALRNNRSTNMAACTGSDNAGMLITDIDNDGHQDVILAGSSDGFAGPVGLNGSHYDFVVLRNVDGTGANFVTFENAGTQYPNGTTNGGTGSLDFPNIAVGDLTGDGLPEVFIQGHHRNYAGDVGSYVFDSMLFLNNGGTSFTEQALSLPDVSEGGQTMADFNNDGKVDLVFTGGSRAFHSNGNNPTDTNSASTLITYVYRNTRP